MHQKWRISQEFQGRVIRNRVKELKIPRYKLAVQIFYGEMKGQGLRIGSK